MTDRFEFVSKQDIFSGEKFNPGTPYELDEFLLTAIVLRDKQTGVMYLWGHRGNSSELTPLLDKEGKPMTTFQKNIKLFCCWRGYQGGNAPGCFACSLAGTGRWPFLFAAKKEPKTAADSDHGLRCPCSGSLAPPQAALTCTAAAARPKGAATRLAVLNVRHLLAQSGARESDSPPCLWRT